MKTSHFESQKKHCSIPILIEIGFNQKPLIEFNTLTFVIYQRHDLV